LALFLLESPLLPILFLFGTLILTVCNTALMRLGKFKSKELLRSSNPPILFFRPLLQRLFPKQEWENLYFSISLSKHIYQIAYATSSFFYLISTVPALHESLPSDREWGPLLLTAGSIIAVSVILDFLLRLAASLWSRPLLKMAAPFASLYLTILFPLIAAFLKITRSLIHKLQIEETDALTDKSRLREMIRESELHPHLEPGDQKLITSFVNFKERVAKEIMVPRVDLFSLSSDTTIREASRLFAAEGYSRIPVYQETLDQIVGVVLYKDLLKCYASAEQNLDASLDTIAKPVLYAPENKKIAGLLQEFRSKQIHMAIIVDEYGGTEGIVTIEDILEELVGEIEDEYDIGEENPFWEIPGGGWIVDAKMTILDIEEQLGVSIPPNPDYETIGGYVYHCAGTIPSKGWRLSRDEFDLEILSSNERAIKKIKLLPRTK
jgi:putative hemolysin